MNMRPLMRKFGGSLSQLKLLALTLMLMLLGNLTGVAAAAIPSYYIPTAVPTSTSTLYAGASGLNPGRVSVDKAGNVFYIGHVSGASTSTLYEIPASSPVVTVTTPTPLITGLAQYNANSTFVDAAGNLWVSNGNVSVTGTGPLYEIPASNGIPNTASLSGGVVLTTITAPCTAAPTTPCVFSSSTAHNITGYYLQATDIYSDGQGNVYVMDYYDSNSSGHYNRVFKFNTSSPSTGTLLVDNLTSNSYAQITVAGDGKVYYCDSVTGHSAGGVVSLISGSALSTVQLAAASLTLGSTYGSGIPISSATGVATDSWGNLIISGATQLDEVPLESGALNFADEFALLVAVSGANSPMYANNDSYGGSFDVHGSYYYASSTNIMQTQINGYNFGNVNVGTKVSSAAPYIDITWGLSTQLVTSIGAPTGSNYNSASLPAAYLQSFPYVSKSYSGGTPYYANTTGQNALVYFQPVHAGLLRGAWASQGYQAWQAALYAANSAYGLDPAYIANLQGVGVGPQPMFIPGVASKAVVTSQLYTTSAHTAAATSFTPQAVGVDTYGDIFVADSANGTLDIDCLSSTQYAGSGGTGGAGTYDTVTCYNTGVGYTYEVGTVSFVTPSGVAMDGDQNAYVLDSSSSSSTNTVTRLFNQSLLPTVIVPNGATVAGTAFSNPKGIALDGYGNLYIADTGNNRIIQGRQYNAQYSQNIVYVPSTLSFGSAKLSGPTGIAVDAAGDLFIADTGNGRIVEYSVTGVASVVSASGITLSSPTGVAVEPSGALVVTDTVKGLFLIANGVGESLSTTTASGTAIPLSSPQGVALDFAGNIYVADSTGDQVVKLNVSSPATATAFPITAMLQTSTETSMVYNNGNAALTFSAAPTVVDNSGAASNEFAVDTNNGCTSTTSLVAAAYCDLEMDFTPLLTASATVPVSGTVTVTDNLQSYTVSSGAGTWGTTGSTQTEALNGQAEGNQTITFNNPTAATIGGVTTSMTPSATATSGLTVTFSLPAGTSDNGICTLSGTTLSFIGVGTCTLNANQSGGFNGTSYWAPAPTATVSFSVQTLPTQTVAFTDTPGTPLVGTTLALTASATPSGFTTFTFGSNTPGICTVTGSTASFIAAGQCIVSVLQSGQGVYASASATQTITVNPGNQIITFASPATQFVGTTLTPTATANSGLPVTFSVPAASSSICTVNTAGTIVSFVGIGSCPITALQVGSANWNATTAAQNVTQTVTVQPGTQTITWPAISTQYVGAPLTLSASVNSNLAITFTVPAASSSVCTASGTNGTTITFVGVGSCPITATPATSANWNPTSTTQTVTVGKGTQSITWGTIVSQYVGTPLTLTATATSGLAVSYSTTSSTCSISLTGVVTFTTPGSCAITAAQAGNSNWNAATSQTQTFTVYPESQTITFGAITAQIVGTPLTLSATSTSGLAVTFTSATPSVCTTSGTNGATANFIAAGSCTIDANQAGNTTYASAAQVAQSFIVNSDVTTTVLISNTTNNMLGTSVMLTATLNSAAGTPTGTVNFLDGTALLGSSPLAAGVAIFTTTSLTAATHSITAVYVPNANLLASTSNAVTINITDFTLTGTGSYSSGGSELGSTQTVVPGKSAIFDLNIAPSAGTSFPAISTFSVSGLPTGATAVLNAPSWSQLTSTTWSLPANTPVGSLALVINVPAATASNTSKDAPFHGLPAVLLGLLLLPFAGRMRRLGKRMGRNLTLLALLMVGIVGMAGLSGCASNNGFFNQPSQSYSVTVTVSVGADSHSNNLTLTVE
jgi:hypothetical protein